MTPPPLKTGKFKLFLNTCFAAVAVNAIIGILGHNFLNTPNCL